MTGTPPPFVSVVTPFHNTGQYLAGCIESVLAQTYQDYEYILLDNQSTDGGAEIAAHYAARDPRIKLFHTDALLPQLDNFNEALRHISPDSKYCKMILADDLLYPECIEKLVAKAEQYPSAWIVSSLYKTDDDIWGQDVDVGGDFLEGREACRIMLLTHTFLIGTCTTILYRSDAIRSEKSFFPTGQYHGDTEAAYRILLDHDLALVNQLLSSIRMDSQSISGQVKDFFPNALDYLTTLTRFGPLVLTTNEYENLYDENWTKYWEYLGSRLFMRRDREFWDYHRAGLQLLGRQLRTRDLLWPASRRLMKAIVRPDQTVARLRLRRAASCSAR